MPDEPATAADTALAIRCVDLCLTYPGGGGISRINLDFGPGTAAIVGNNGAGKSTLLETIAGLRTPTSGQITLFGKSPRAWRSMGAHTVGVALQDGRPYPSATPQALLNYLHDLYASSSNRSMAPTVDFLVQAFALNTRTSIKNLSGGELQRLKCATALMPGAPIVILDEPTAGLDPQGRRDLYAVLASVVPVDSSVLVSTHILEDLESINSRVIAIKDGAVAYDSIASPTSSVFCMTFTSRHNLDLSALHKALPEGVKISETINGRYSIISQPQINAAFIATVMNFCAQIGAEVSEVQVRQLGGVMADVEDLLLGGGTA